eukprot:Gb_17723 [translate_table: standard]
MSAMYAIMRIMVCPSHQADINDVRRRGVRRQQRVPSKENSPRIASARGERGRTPRWDRRKHDVDVQRATDGGGEREAGREGGAYNIQRSDGLAFANRTRHRERHCAPEGRGSAGSGIVGGGGGSPCINRPPKLEMGSNPVKGGEESPVDKIQRLTMENAVVVFSMTSCCMCHVVKRLFCSLGVNPAVCELDEDGQGAEMEKILLRLVGQKPSLPAVFIGGKLVGGLDRLMAMHISGDLVPKLKEAGALWL